MQFLEFGFVKEKEIEINTGGILIVCYRVIILIPPRFIN